VIISIEETGFKGDIFIKKKWSKEGIVQTSYSSSFGENLSLKLAISQERVIGFTARDGPSNTFSFCCFMQKLVHYLNTHLQYQNRRKIYLMDNASFDCSEIASGLIQQLGIEVLCNASYTPQLNPIDKSFHKLKSRVRKISTLSRF